MSTCRRRWAALLIEASLAVALLACSSDPTEPQPELQPQDEPLVAADVSAAGDSLRHDDIEVMVPAGALSAPHTLTVWRTPSPLQPGTDTYRLSGLPSDFARPITFRLRLVAAPPAQPTPELTVLLSATTAGDTLRAATAVTAAIDGEYLAGTLDPGEYLVAPTAALGKHRVPDDFILDLLLSGSAASTVTHVEVPMPIHVRGDDQFAFYRSTLLTWLVEAAEAIRPLTGNLTQVAYPDRAPQVALIEGRILRSNYPSCWIEDYVQANPGGTVSFEIRMRVNPDHPVDLADLQGQCLRGIWSKAYFARTGFSADWWRGATSAAVVRDVIAGYEPAYWTGGVRNPLVGYSRTVNDASDTDAQWTFSDAMVPLACWVDDHPGAGWGDEALTASLIARVHDPDNGPAFLAEVLPGTPRQWWPEFARDLVCGQAPYCATAFMLDHVDDNWVLDDADDVATAWTQRHYCLDGALYRIHLARDDFHPAATLGFTLTSHDDRRLSLFKLVDGVATFLADEVPVSVANLDDLAAEGADLLALVTFAGTSSTAPGVDLTLAVDLDEPDPGAEVFSMTSARTQLSWFGYQTAAAGVGCTEGRNIARTYFLSGWFADGAWNGTTFVGTRTGEVFDGPDGHLGYQVDIEVQVSGDGQSVLAVDYTYSQQDFNDDGGADLPDAFEVHRITYSGALPNVSPYAYDVDFGGQGLALVGGAVYTETHWTEGDDCVYETVSFELAEDCRMYVSFQGDGLTEPRR